MTNNRHRMRFSHAALVAAALFLSFAGTANAWPPGGNGNGNGGGGPGGGGGDPPSTGTVYIYHDHAVWTMKPDGSQLTELPVSGVGFGDQPSHDLHGGQRWFTNRVSDGQPVYPNGRWFTEIWTVSETGVPALILSEPDIEVLAPPVWLADDQSLSFVGERWTFDAIGEPTTLTEAGLYVVDIDYDALGNIVGAVPGSLTLILDLSPELRIDADGFDYNSEVAGHSWAPTQSAFAFGVRHQEPNTPWDEEIWVMNLVQPDDSALLSDASGSGWPEWSPDGQYIGYVSHAGTYIYDFARGRDRLLGRTPSTAWGISHWSPDGSQFVISHWDNFSGYDGIYRFNARLSGKTLLVDDSLCPDDNILFNCTLITLGWRE